MWRITVNLTYKYDHYYLYSEIETIMKGYAEKYPQYARLTTIGVTPEGRMILLMEITDTSTGAYEEKSAFYAEGCIHAGELTGSMTVMYLMDTIFSNLEEPSIASMLKEHTVYCLPRVSPDGSEYYLTTPDTVRSINRYYPYEREMPGLQPKDLDGDGVLRTMRVKTPYGMWKKSEKDSRLMTHRRPDDVEGDFYNVYTEGEILDFDGINVKMAPAKYGYDNNRSYPIGWEPEWKQHGAGELPLYNPETQANARFLLNHRNIAAVIDMHTFGGMILYTPGYMSAKKADPADIALYKALGQMGHEESGYPVLNVYDEFMAQGDPATYGGFDDFCHFVLGIPAHTIECWDIWERAGSPQQYPPKDNPTWEESEEEEMKVLHWVDANVPEGQGWKDWTEFDHPQLGKVEIGGMDFKYILQNPPVAFLAQECDKHTRFMLREIKALPRLVIDETRVKKISEDIYQVEIVAGNRGFMSTYVFKAGLKNPQLPPMTMKLCCEGEMELIQGKRETELPHLAGFASLMGSYWGIPAKSFAMEAQQVSQKFVIRAKEGTKVTVTVAGGHAGQVKASFELK